jgi:elongation factor 1-gamma
MSKPIYTLHTPQACFQAFKSLIAAEYNGIQINIPKYDENLIKTLSPLSKPPVLVTKSGNIFESNSIARFIAKLRRDTNLYGPTLHDETNIDAWIDYCNKYLEIPCYSWWCGATNKMPFHEEVYKKSKNDVSAVLKILNKHLLTRTYLVGEYVTLADIVVVSTLVYPFKFVCEKSYLKEYGNVLRWFLTCVNQVEFKAVIGEVEMCKKELMAEGHTGASVTKSSKRKDETIAEAPLAVPKKTEHPYKIMDKNKPSSFIMDVWKKTYSNTSPSNTLSFFWESYDSQGWSLWHQSYKYNDENKRLFITSNAVGGFQQRTEEIRKWAFGVMHILGTEETVLEIKGVWLLRGNDVNCMMDANDDANWYTWKKLGGKDLKITEEDKELVRSYWVEKTLLEGKEIQDTKVFK